MEIQHFLHEHPLKLHENTDLGKDLCSGCEKQLSSSGEAATYGCSECQFVLHESCAKLPQVLQHFFHPCSLFLRIENFICNGCYSHRRGCFSYRCKKCDFDLDVDCIKLPTIKSEGEEKIQHYSHLHPLTLLGELGGDNNAFFCKICGDLCSGTIAGYGCSNCKFYIHKSCMDMVPQQTHVSFHPCQLVLLTTSSFRCGSCGKKFSGLTFRCGKCSFQVCVGCSLFSTTTTTKVAGKQVNCIRLHEHPLKLYESTDFDEDHCYGCEKLLSGHTIYCCSECDFFLHESCALLPHVLQHFFHPCPLFLSIESFRCNGCYSDRAEFLTYHCEKCDFDLDIDCAQFPTIKSEGEEKIQHYSHLHPLTFLGELSDDNDKYSCKVCGNLCSYLTASYGCSNCEFYIHKSCMDILPQQIQVFFHPCQLVLLTTLSFRCDVCGKEFSGLTFRCGKCYFEVCVGCFLLSTTIKDADKQITHFSHRHPLVLFENLEFQAFCFCTICTEICVTLTYGCQECSFYFHKSCMDIVPQEIELFFHPCPLIPLSTSSYKCDACWEDHFGVFFRCKPCRFKLCVECSMMRIVSTDVDDKLEGVKHFSHHHPLILSEKMEDDYEVPCVICGKSSSDYVCECSECEFYFHKACMNILPQKIEKHFFHSCPHSCPLILLRTPSYRCCGCDKSCAGLTFRCGRCEFHLCVECSLLPTVQSGACEKIQHFLHKHPLILCEKDLASDVFCNACGTPCLGPTYGCSRCKLFLHKTCAELPQKIRNFSHLSHSLVLASQNSEEGRRVLSKKKSTKAKCCLCLKDCCDFAFCCKKCNIQLDVECAFLKPEIDYPGHNNHLLTVVDNIYDNLECNFCKACCKDLPAYRCLECNFGLHLLCGPLPCTIKHKCHIDTLTLKDQYVEDDADDDEFYCDACERRRDPRLCVYYCELGCPMIVEVKCVISEVLASLRGKHGTVELRVVGRYKTSRIILRKENIKKSKGVQKASLSLDEILVSLDTVERRQLDDIEASVRQEVKTTIVSHESDNGTDTPVYYSEESFTRFMEGLNSAMIETEIPDFVLEHKDFTAFQDYLVPRSLIPTLQDLLGMNKDICDKSMLSPRTKSLIFYFLCSVIENMRATRFMDLTDRKLGEWFACLKWVKHADFKFQFISEHMEHVARAHFAVQARKFVEEAPVQLQKQIEQISQEIKELTIKLRTLEEQQEITNQHVESTTINLSKQFSKVPWAIKWKPVADGLL